MGEDDTLYRWVLPALVVLAVWHFGRSWTCNLHIRVRAGDVQVAGKVGEKRALVITDFWRAHMDEVSHVWVDGHWDGRRLQLRCSASMTAGQRQRLRNFLMTIL